MPDLTTISAIEIIYADTSEPDEEKLKEDSDLSAIDKSHKNIKQFNGPELGRNDLLHFPSATLFTEALFGSYSLLDFAGNVS